MYELWYDYLKPKYDEKEKKCVIWLQFHCIDENRWFKKMLKLILINTWPMKVDHYKKYKVIWLMKHELGEKIMIRFFWIKSKNL